MSILTVVGMLLFTVFIAVPLLLGYYLIYVGIRFKKSAKATADKTAFWFNWLAFIWMWAERAKEIVAAMPFFKQDLSETLGVKPDDGRAT